MVTFHVPRPGAHSPDHWLTFRVPEQAVMIAGSRNGHLPPHTASLIVAAMAQNGFSFLVGCARGIDQRFRSTLAVSNAAADSSFIACAFASRVETAQKQGLFASLVVPQGLSPAAALRRRTLWMVKRSVLLFLFPDDPATGKWGRGSSLAYRAAVDQLKPVFVVTTHPPAESSHYHLLPSSYFGIVDGYWVVPHPVAEGTCDEEW